MRIATFVLAALALSSSACLSQAPAPAKADIDPALDKAALFADAGLLPTREGERARRELALAGELRKAARVLAWECEVDIQLGDGRSSARVSIVGRPLHPVDDAALARDREDLEALAAALVPGLGERDDAVRVLLRPEPSAALGAAEPAADQPALPVAGRLPALLLTAIALGASLGMGLERLRLRRLTAASS